jgi:hypothetical protein
MLLRTRDINLLRVIHIKRKRDNREKLFLNNSLNNLFHVKHKHPQSNRFPAVHNSVDNYGITRSTNGD